MKKLTKKAVETALKNNYFLRDYIKVIKTTHLNNTEHEYNSFVVLYYHRRMDIDIMQHSVIGSCSGFVTNVVMQEFCNLLSNLESEIND